MNEHLHRLERGSSAVRIRMARIGGRWQAASGGVRLATECSVQSVAVRLQRDDGSWLPIEQVLGTFIHEMAHVVRVEGSRQAYFG